MEIRSSARDEPSWANVSEEMIGELCTEWSVEVEVEVEVVCGEVEITPRSRGIPRYSRSADNTIMSSVGSEALVAVWVIPGRLSCPLSGQVRRFWVVPGSYRGCTGVVLGLYGVVPSYWGCTGVVPGLYWGCTGVVLGLYRVVPSYWGRTLVVLGSYLACAGVVPGLCWGHTGVVPGLYRGCTGVVPGLYWGRTVVPGSYRGRTLVVLGSYRGCTGVVPGLYWGRTLAVLGSFYYGCFPRVVGCDSGVL